MHAHIVIVHTNRYRVRRIRGIYEFLYKPWINAFPCVSVKSTKIYFKVSLHARDTPASERSHERFMLTKSPLTHTTTTHRRRRRRRRRDGGGRRRTRKARLRESICGMNSIPRNWNNRCHLKAEDAVIRLFPG